MKSSFLCLCVTLGLGSFGCGEGMVAGGDDGDSSRDPFEAWNAANNPLAVDPSFVVNLDKLPVSGEATPPWSGTYWPTAMDSINDRWDGPSSLSPAEKAARAFNLPGFPGWVTNHVGIYGQGAKACDGPSECGGDYCVRPRGVSGSKTGRCIAGWWGICHGWAPAAISEPTPSRSVTSGLHVVADRQARHQPGRPDLRDGQAAARPGQVS
jgi:hypothetical protein